MPPRSCQTGTWLCSLGPRGVVGRSRGGVIRASVGISCLWPMNHHQPWRIAPREAVPCVAHAHKDADSAPCRLLLPRRAGSPIALGHSGRRCRLVSSRTFDLIIDLRRVPDLTGRSFVSGGVSVEAYSSYSRRGHQEKARFRQGHRTLSGLRDGTKTLYGVGSRLTPESTKRRPRDGRSKHESTRSALPDGNRTSDQMVGGSNPSGRATLYSGLREPDPRRGVKHLVFMSGVAGDSRCVRCPVRRPG